MSTTILSTPGHTSIPTAELRSHFARVFDRISEGVLAREEQRVLPYEQVGWLKEAGFGRVRIPREHGGFGASLEQLAVLLIDLGAADSNLVQAWRGHIGFVEFVLSHANGDYRAFWLAELATGVMVGNAESERTGHFATPATHIHDAQEVPDGVELTGTKYYSTGSIYADWIFVSAADRRGGGSGTDTALPPLVSVQVRRDHPGVDIQDDWDGFGQRLTGSGTATFTAVPADPQLINPRVDESAGPSVQHAVYQLTHLSALAGIVQAAHRDITAFITSRSRNLFNPTIALTEDTMVQQVVGETYGAVKTIEASVLAAAASLDRALASGDPADHAAGDAHLFAVQGTVIELALHTVGRVFEVGGASATSTSRALDRHWRNARTISSHNPAILRQRVVGDYLLNGTSPAESTARILTGQAGQTGQAGH
ncbi:acyl-CoA dehydrogenase family protein [Citricoccus parietis]|uniref:Acyl-CoA dehydrogenase family protein n=1 Tax=Citricoccus parietis TaxID=592307 RepID=A0ABV6F6D9_9MICC